MKENSNEIVKRSIAEGRIPLAWSGNGEAYPYANLGDALSVVIVMALSGLGISRASFSSDQERFAAIGTIAHEFVGGTIHLWGTGIDRNINPVNRRVGRYTIPVNTNIVPWAVRGPHTRHILINEGIEVPTIYGDAAWFLPSIYNPQIKPKYELGIVLHISELETANPASKVRQEYLRYRLGSQESAIRLINTYHDRNIKSLLNKTDEILSCKRILSTSFHGLLLADAYRIPCAYFGLSNRGEYVHTARLGEPGLDHRVADFYGGTSAQRVIAYHQSRSELTNWDEAIAFVDREWAPIEDDFTEFRGSFRFPQLPDPSLEGLWDLQL